MQRSHEKPALKQLRMCIINYVHLRRRQIHCAFYSILHKMDIKSLPREKTDQQSLAMTRRVKIVKR